jgi:drug/metabolite transporter (DMT)-like permease
MPSPAPSPTPSIARVYATLSLVMLLWAGNSIVARAVHDSIPPFSLAFFRWTGALLVLLAWARMTLPADAAAIRRHWRPILLLGAVGVGCFNALLYSGLRYTTATNALLIQAAIPATVLIFDRILFRVRPRLAQIAGVTIAALGVIVIIFRADPAALLALSFGRGDALVLAAVVAWALYTALLKLRPPIAAASFLFVTFLIGAVAMLPPAIAEWQAGLLHPTHGALLGIAYVAIFPSVLAYFLFNKAVAEIGAGPAGQMIALQPLFGALLAMLLLGETLHRYHLAGMALILAGIALPLVGRRGPRAIA